MQTTEIDPGSSRMLFASYIILAFVIIIFIIIIVLTIHYNYLEYSNVATMDSLYSTLNGNIQSINPSLPDFSGNLYEYYIRTSYNSCSGGNYKNGYVNIEILKDILKQGVRGLDFEIYSIDNQPVVSTSTGNNYHVKETFNSVPFSAVMSTINSYAFASGTAPNPKDPILINLRIQSNNQAMYSNLASMFKSYDSIMLGPLFSYENNGQNLGALPLLAFMGKVILIVDKSNTAFLENNEFLEYVNLTSNSLFMRGYDYNGVVNNPDVNELTQYNETGMTLVIPDNGSSPPNPNGILCRASGCQMVAMRFQNTDSYLSEDASFFNQCGYAFCLKPQDLRYTVVTIPAPTPQNPNYSYATRNVSTNYYNINT